LAGAAGDALLAPAVTRRLISEFARLWPREEDRSVPALDALTARETQVLRLVAGETAKTHVSRVLTKLRLRDRTQAVVAACESGLVVPRSSKLP
jgi:DNA-binding NarL/FixJ family response regulator